MAKNSNPKALNNEQEKKVSGGYLYDGGVVKGLAHEVLDDATGEVVGRYSSREKALTAAKEKGQSTEDLNWSTIKELRKTKTR